MKIAIETATKDATATIHRGLTSVILVLEIDIVCITRPTIGLDRPVPQDSVLPSGRLGAVHTGDSTGEKQISGTVSISETARANDTGEPEAPVRGIVAGDLLLEDRRIDDQQAE